MIITSLYLLFSFSANEDIIPSTFFRKKSVFSSRVYAYALENNDRTVYII